MRYKAGDKVMITKDDSCHMFPIGSIQTIESTWTLLYFAKNNKGKLRYFTDEECELAEPESKLSQCDLIRKHLESHYSVTPLEALESFGCFRLSARINDLKKEGMSIKTEMVKTDSGKFVAKYSIGT